MKVHLASGVIAVLLPVCGFGQADVVYRVTTVAGNGTLGRGGDGGPAIQAQLSNPQEAAVDRAGNLYIADEDNHNVRKVTPEGVMSTFAGIASQPGYSGDGGRADLAKLFGPQAVCTDTGGNVYIADTYNHRIRKVTPQAGIITTIAGIGIAGYSGDGGAATSASLNMPRSCVADATGGLYFSDTMNNVVRKISPQGYISTYAIGFDYPVGLALDAQGNLYVADARNNRIRRVTPRSATDFAGVRKGFSGDGGPATAAALDLPYGVAVDKAGSVHIADLNNHRIRRVTTPDGIIGTVAGTGVRGFSGDGGPAAQAQFNQPHSTTMDSAGNLYVTDTGNYRIRKLAPIAVQAAVNAASSSTGSAAPGEFVSLYGSGFGPDKAVPSTDMLRGLGGVKVTFNGIEAFLTYVSATQINALVPYGVTDKADVVVEFQGIKTSSFPLQVTNAAPGIFTQQYGPGPAWVVNQDQTFNSDKNAAGRESYVAFWATGQGLVDPAGKDGDVIIPPNFPKPVLPVKVTIGGVEAEVVAFAGLIYTGVLQVNVKVPPDAPTGNAVELLLTVGNAISRKGVTMAVQ